MKEILFSEESGRWVADFISDGLSVMQIERLEKGELAISQYIEGMPPCAYKKYSDYNGRDNLVVGLSIVEGMHVRVESKTEIRKCYVLQSSEPIATFSCADEGVCYDSTGELLQVRI